uniref:Uncharacterized protein n=1 Tax=Arundo donax TaxID=35708 RepID=A0A0A9BH58_ARUDO
MTRSASSSVRLRRPSKEETFSSWTLRPVCSWVALVAI